ncbi:MAG: MmcQ/YjbR family DNA-binding protein [Caulobacteraceae bacterium]|nr:MmcQ/YjbR family DNA-binding protein [Caulobacteraceae bacterium]
MRTQDIRRLALSMPEAAPGDDHGSMAFIVAGKIFRTLSADAPRAVFKLDPEDQANLSVGHPGLVEPVPGYWGNKGWTYLWYEPADEALVVAIMHMAWAKVAPASLRKASGQP